MREGTRIGRGIRHHVAALACLAATAAVAASGAVAATAAASGAVAASAAVHTRPATAAGATMQARARDPEPRDLVHGIAQLPGPGSSDQAVAVAYLQPSIVLSLDVVTGRLQWSGLALGFSPRGGPWSTQRPTTPWETGVIGIYDPLDHTLYRYEGGIAGFAAASPATAAGLPAPGHLPMWGAPRLVRRGTRLLAIVLPDARRVALSSDGADRITGVEWPGAHGERLRTRISYAGNLTTIVDPFGVARTYEHQGARRAFELVPAAWRRGPGYRHFITPVLDSARETGWVQYRTVLQHPPYTILTDGLAPIAGRAWGDLSFDSAANGGYIDLGLRSLRPARALEREMERRGLLDVTAILPTYDSAAQLLRLDDSLQPAFHDFGCRIAFGEGIDSLDITVASTLTAAQRATLDAMVEHLDAWSVIEVRGTSECGTLDATAAAAGSASAP